MPTPEQQPDNQPTPQVLDGMPEPYEAEQPFKTIAVRVQESLHAQLSFIAQLSGSSISEEIRQAIERRIATAQDDPDLIARAETVRQQIEREAAARTAAIAGFMGQHAVTTTASEPAARTPRTRRTNSGGEQAKE